LKYAYYPGCVAKSSARELYESTTAIADKLGIKLVELTSASCCGAGVMNDGDPFLSTVLNARTFAMAESKSLDILTICSTCQGVMNQVKWQLEKDGSLLPKVNKALAKINLKYEGKTRIKHLLQVLIEDYKLSRLEAQVTKPLKGLKVAPFYGCYLLRPHEALQFDDHEKPTSLDQLINILGGEPVHYDGETKCCGFPILFVQRETAFEMSGNYLDNARKKGADFVVTPCPLCHLSLDAYQPKSSKKIHAGLNLPVMHVSQMVGLALGLEISRLGFSKHIVPMTKVLHAFARSQ
jgi:succinate dehydrogenase / fumarate reductase cytochrome b subunit